MARTSNARPTEAEIAEVRDRLAAAEELRQTVLVGGYDPDALEAASQAVYDAETELQQIERGEYRRWRMRRAQRQAASV